MTTGAESDLEPCTSIARQMVGRWGMSDAIGPVSVLPAADGQMRFPGEPRSASDASLELVDMEVRALTDRCYVDALHRLTEHRPQLNQLAAALLAAETLDEAVAYAAAGMPAPASER